MALHHSQYSYVDASCLSTLNLTYCIIIPLGLLCGTNTYLQNCHKAFSTFIITISLCYFLTDASIDKYDIAYEQWLGMA